jgi:3-deoxy-D-manno-octulosonic-acid transferase
MHPLLSAPYAAARRRSRRLLASAPFGGEARPGARIRAASGLLERIERWAPHAPRHRTRPLLWMHAPSVGEGLQARPVIERIRARIPTWQLALHLLLAQRRTLRRGMLDAGPSTHRLPAVRHRGRRASGCSTPSRPLALVFAKLDLWPRLAEAAAARGVRLGMISATLSEGSGRSGALARALLGDAYACARPPWAPSTPPTARDSRRWACARTASASPATHATTRWRRAPRPPTARARAARGPLATARVHARRRIHLARGRSRAARRRGWRCAKHPERATRSSRRTNPPPAHRALGACATAHDLESFLGDRAPATLLARGWPTRAPTHDVVLVDRVGVLGELYALATAAYVGGGFHAAGLHSVLEPAAFGAPGPLRPAAHATAATPASARSPKAPRRQAPSRTSQSLTRALRILLTETRHPRTRRCRRATGRGARRPRRRGPLDQARRGVAVTRAR